MANSRRSILAACAAATLLAGCAVGPYDNGYDSRYGYDNGYGYAPGYYDAPGYYVQPQIGFGFAWSDRDRRDYRGDRRDWRGDDRDRGDNARRGDGDGRRDRDGDGRRDRDGDRR